MYTYIYMHIYTYIADTASFPPAITYTHTHLETPIEHAIIDGKAPVRRGELGKDGQSAGACVDEHSEGLPRRSHRDVDKVLGSHVVDRHRHMVDPVPARTLPSHYNTPRQTRRKANASQDKLHRHKTSNHALRIANMHAHTRVQSCCT